MKLNVLISIYPEYVQQILNRKKKYEYRKHIFKKQVDKVYIYSTSPVQKIVGFFKYTGYLEESPEKLWEVTKNFSGIGEKSYYQYFDKKPIAYAIKIEQLHIFQTPIDPKQKFGKFIPPQSFMYIEGDL